MVLLDLQKIFHTIDHEIFCNTLASVELDKSSVTWFRSYLLNRTQIEEINNTRSDPLPITCVVPQGSLLGPLLFLVYYIKFAMYSKFLRTKSVGNIGKKH